MAGYRSTFIKATSKLSGLFSLEKMIRRSGHHVILPVYHMVSNQPPVHIRHLYQVKSEREFIRDLDQLLKYYSPVTYPELLSMTAQGKKSGKNAFLLTFDDGLAEFHDIIAPILVKKGIPAINFLNSDFIGNKDLFFRYKVSILIDRLKHAPELLEMGAVKQWHQEQETKSANDIFQKLLNIRFDTKASLDRLAHIIGVDFDDYLRKNKPYLEDAQIRSLISQGFYFGAHSCDHPEYRFLDMKEQLRQTRESVKKICDRFTLDYAVFAFPFTDFGVSEEFFRQLNGVEKTVDLSFGSAGLKIDPIPYHWQRIPMEMGNLDAEQVIRGEYVYDLLKGFLRKNKMERI